jgi:hypothetical protein
MGLACIMGPATFLIAILGCGEAEAPCQQVRTLEAQYQSQAACTAATDQAILSNSDVDFPVIVARCIAAGKAPSPLKANEVERPGPGSAQVRHSPLSR